MIALVVATIVAANVAEPVKLAATGLSTVGLDEARAEFFTEHLAEKLTARGVSVVTPREVGAVIGLERQKQLLGCADDSTSCVAEIANALGVDGLVLGTVAKIGGAFQVDLKIVGAQNAQRLASYSERVSAEEEVLEALAKGAESMAVQAASALGRPLPQGTGGSTMRRWFWVPAAAGALFAAGGVSGLVQAEGTRQQLASEQFSRTQADALLAQGQRARFVGYTGIAIGFVGLVASGVLYGMSAGEPQVAFHATIAPGAMTVGISGALP